MAQRIEGEFRLRASRGRLRAKLDVRLPSKRTLGWLAGVAAGVALLERLAYLLAGG